MVRLPPSASRAATSRMGRLPSASFRTWPAIQRAAAAGSLEVAIFLNFSFSMGSGARTSSALSRLKSTVVRTDCRSMFGC